MQRQTLKHGERLFERSLDIQRNSAETFLENSFAIQRNAQRQGAELTKELFDAQFEAFQSTFDDDEVRSAVNRQLDTSAELSQQVLNAQFEQGTDLIEQLVDGQFDAFESAFDDDEVRDAVISQLEELNASQSEAWDAFEEDFREAVDDMSVQQREVAAQSVQAVLTAQEEIKEEAIENAQQSEEVARETAENAAEAAEAQSEVAVEATEKRLEDIEGLGSTYADRLREYGIESNTHLAQANAETIAQAADVSEDQAEQWSQRANSQA
jgi:predicted flap endonuclease-1-like 5' DNA nuclease